MIQKRFHFVGFWYFVGFWLLLLLTPMRGHAQSNVPMIGSGQMPTPVPADDQMPTNVLQVRLAAGVRFDDNAEIGSLVKRSDVSYSFTPNVAFVQTRKRLDWGLSYGPGVDISEHRLYADQFTNIFGGYFTWAISRHGVLSAQENYILSTNPFQQFGSQPFTTTPGPVVAPNQSIYLSNIRRKTSMSQAQYSYQLGAHTTFGMGGNYNLSHYADTSGSGTPAPLINSQIASGQAYLSHQFTPRNQVGFQYGGQVLKFPQANSRTTTHTFLIFDEIKLTPHSSLSVYGGPEYSLTSNQVLLNFGFVLVTIPVKANTWSWSAGGIYTLNGRRGAMVLNYSRRVSDGGGLTGAVELNGGSADFKWKLSPRWDLGLDLAAADNQLLAVKVGQNELLTYSASVSLRRQLYQHLFMNLFFERLNQTGALTGFPAGNHDIAGVSISYDFLKPIGR